MKNDLLDGYGIEKISPNFAVKNLAEREGFEPSVELVTLHSLSRRAPSANSAISPQSNYIF